MTCSDVEVAGHDGEDVIECCLLRLLQDVSAMPGDGVGDWRRLILSVFFSFLFFFSFFLIYREKTMDIRTKETIDG